MLVGKLLSFAAIPPRLATGVAAGAMFPTARSQCPSPPNIPVAIAVFVGAIGHFSGLYSYSCGSEPYFSVESR